MAYGMRFIQPGYKRSLQEGLHDQKVKMAAGISGRWMPSSKELRFARVGAVMKGMAQREIEAAKEPYRSAMSRRFQQSMALLGRAKSRLPMAKSLFGKFGQQEGDPSLPEGVFPYGSGGMEQEDRMRNLFLLRRKQLEEED